MYIKSPVVKGTLANHLSMSSHDGLIIITQSI